MTNSVERLHFISTNLHNALKEFQGRNPVEESLEAQIQYSCMSLWARATGYTNNNLSVIQKLHEEIPLLVLDTQETVIKTIRNPKAQKTYLHILNPFIDRYYDADPYLHVSEMKVFEQRFLNNLNFCQLAILPFFDDSPPIENEFLSLENEIQNLISSIKKSDLDNNIKSFFLDNLEDLLNSLALYRIRGEQALGIAISKSIGTALLYKGMYQEEASRNVESEEISTQFWKNMERFIVLCDSFSFGTKVLQNIKELMGDPGYLITPSRT